MEERRFIRVFVIGKEGVGKTSLVRSLMYEKFKEEDKHTDGINIDVCRCKIREYDKQWLIAKDSDAEKALKNRIQEVIKQKKNKTPNNKIGEDINIEDVKGGLNRKTALQNGKTEGTTINPYSITESMTHLINVSQETTIREQTHEQNLPESMTHVNDGVDSDDLEAVSQTKQTLTDERLGKISNELKCFVNDVNSSGKRRTDKCYDLGFWDFAGERVYYETHQTFLNPHALFLLVTCVTDFMQDDDVKLKSVAEYQSFWFNTVHSCAIKTKLTQEEDSILNPPIIVVCTGIDKWECKDEKELKEKKKKVWDKLQENMDTTHRKYFRKFVFVSNLQPGNHKYFKKLRDHIYTFGKELTTCKEKIPANWITLERLLIAVKKANVNILSFSDIKKLALQCAIDSEDDVKSFLKYHHKVGNIIFFEEIQDYIIICQQWLADAFKCLVTTKVDKMLQLSDSWRKLTNTGELQATLITKLLNKDPERHFNENKQHILGVMEVFDILAKPPKSKTYYMPCMITKKIELNDLYEMFLVNEHKDNRTPWLILDFNFMPFFMFKHVTVYLLRKYDLCEERSSNESAIYHDKAVFYLDKKNGIQLAACYVENAIALQIWKRSYFKSNDLCKNLLHDLQSAIEIIKQKSVANNVSYTVKAKCFNGDIDSDKGRVTYEDLLRSENGEYYCEEHCTHHAIKDLSTTWFEKHDKPTTPNYNKELPAETNLTPRSKLPQESAISEKPSERTPSVNIFGDGKPVDRAAQKPEVEERFRREREDEVKPQTAEGNRNEMLSDKMQGMNILDRHHGYVEIPQDPLERLEPLRRDKMLRRKTFEKWPRDSGINPDELCNDGFYYMGMNDKVQCVYCGGVLSDWRKDDNVHMEHARHFGRCPSLSEHDNIRNGSDVMGRADANIGGHQGYEFGHSNDDIPSKVKSESSVKGYNSKFSRFDQRLESFKDWPADHILKKEQLATAGLYYKGPGDKCQCFMCGGMLSGWEQGDNPEAEHKKWFKKCALSKA